MNWEALRHQLDRLFFCVLADGSVLLAISIVSAAWGAELEHIQDGARLESRPHLRT